MGKIGSKTLSTQKVRRAIVPPEQRVWKYVTKTDSCWVWTGAVCGRGYGLMARGRRDEGRIRVHKYVYQLFRGEYDPKLDLHHICENKRCCNPAHLEPLTRSQHIAKTPNAVSNRQRELTHCANGHLYTPENTYIWKRRRTCRICNLEYTHRRRERQRAGQ